MNLLLGILAITVLAGASDATTGSSDASADRLDWWREARFGMFVHWGLYAVPAGEWKGETDHGEWIRSSAQIPLAAYDSLRAGFAAPDFDADTWARLARRAGMSYLVITTKHHDGFCLFDCDATDFDVAATPLGRDVMREVADACHREGIRLGWYYSIMDWHHPDYLPRRDWERDRPPDAADLDRYVAYMKAQLRELLTRYGPIDILWFDGQWEGSWDNERGRDLLAYVRSLQPDILVNNRIGRGGGDFGLDTDQGPLGDFGTPEQHVPAQGVPGVDWETCLTMNRHWGYNRADEDFKSATELIRTLVDVASKGGNLLLNVGPDARGRIPDASVQRLEAMGAWFDVNGEAIRGTTATSLPAQAWGRATQRRDDAGATRIYLHIFARPAGGEIAVTDLLSDPARAYLLADPRRTPLAWRRAGADLAVAVPPLSAEAAAAVVVLEIDGRPDVASPPVLTAEAPIFVDELRIAVASSQDDVELRYTSDGSIPTAASALAGTAITLREGATVTVRSFRQGMPVSPPASATYTRVTPRPARTVGPLAPGLACACVEGGFEVLPDFASVAATPPIAASGFELSARPAEARFACRFTGYVEVPVTGVYRFHLRSDDGSRLWLDDELLVDNDGLHSSHEESGYVALAAGHHALTVAMFELTGGFELAVAWTGPDQIRQPVPSSSLWHDASERGE